MPSWNRYKNVPCENCGTQKPKLQSLILLVTKRDVQLEHCIVPNVQFSPQNHKMIWITILLRTTAPKNLISLSSVNFVIKSFRVLCFTSSQKRSKWNTFWIRSKRCGFGEHSGKCWRSNFETRIGNLQTLFDRYWNRELKTQSLQIYHVILRHAFAQR